jgi:hypothetical protein
MLQVVTDIRLPFSDRYSPEYFLSIDEVDKVISLNMNPVRNLHNNALVISEHCARNLNYFGSVDNAHQITVLYNIAKVYTSNKSSIDELLQLLKNEKFIYYYEYGIGIINLYFKKDYVPFVLELNETKLHNMIIEFEEVLQCH